MKSIFSKVFDVKIFKILLTKCFALFNLHNYILFTCVLLKKEKLSPLK